MVLVLHRADHARRVDADCEARDDWFLEQDASVWSSFAYLAAGALVVAIVVRQALPRSFLALGTLVALEGVGSFLYHGHSGTLGEYLHDVPLLGIVGFVAGWHASRLRRPAGSGSEPVGGAAVGLVAGGIRAALGVTSVFVAVAVAVVVGTEVVTRRRGLRRVWNVALIVLAALSAASWWAGSTIRPERGLTSGVSPITWCRRRHRSSG